MGRIRIEFFGCPTHFEVDGGYARCTRCSWRFSRSSSSASGESHLDYRYAITWHESHCPERVVCRVCDDGLCIDSD